MSGDGVALLIIGICDKKVSHRKIIKNCIESAFFDKAEIKIIEYDNEDVIINSVSFDKTRLDLIILDADCCGGMSLAECIREEKTDTDIIIYTESPKYVFEGYKYGVFDYILKSEVIDRFNASLFRYIKDRLGSLTKYLCVRANGSIQNIKLEKIIYFESNGRKISAISDEESIEFYQKMDELILLLPKNCFVRCHRSYTVNIDEVYSFDSVSLMLKNGMRLPISRKYYQNFKALFDISIMS